MEHEFKDVGEVGEMGTGTGYLKGVATKTVYMYVGIVSIIHENLVDLSSVQSSHCLLRQT